jgi:hypothetical protein
LPQKSTKNSKDAGRGVRHPELVEGSVQRLVEAVNVARILNYVSYVAVLVSYALTGLVLSLVQSVYRGIYRIELPGKPLPEITEWLMRHVSYPTTFFFELVLGLLFCGLFLFLEHGDVRKRAFLPVSLTAGLVISWFQVSIALVAFSMPQISLH